MKIDKTSFFFNASLNDGTATCAWATSVGQSQKYEYRIDSERKDIVDFLIGLSYKSIGDLSKLDKSKASENRELLICSIFDKVYVNDSELQGYKYIVTFCREHTPSHDGRLLISYAKYLKYKDDNGIIVVDNEETIKQMFKALGCTDDACWFAYEINVINQNELHFEAVIVDKRNSVTYQSSDKRSSDWDSLILEDKRVRQLSPLQKIYFGSPGSGKSHKVDEIYQANKNNGTCFRTIFHPDSDYSTFVGCYKPIVGGSKKISYEFVPQVFTDAYVKAWENTSVPVYLIIEEINRGNCAQVFGDLFQLLDRTNGVSDYPINADHDLRAYIEEKLGVGHEGIKDGKLKLPANLNILATMNTSDQSLFPMDSAFKRRWEWEYVPINYSDIDDDGKPLDSYNFTITFGGNKYRWIDFLKKVNNKIKDVSKSEDKQMGNFFIKHDVDEKEFCNKVMFYLWNDVAKDYYESNDNLFQTKENHEDENGKSTKHFSYNELFGENCTKLLEGFFKMLDVKQFEEAGLDDGVSGGDDGVPGGDD